MSRRPGRWLTAIALVVAQIGAYNGLAIAQLPAPRLTAVFPAGGQQGTQFELTLTGIADLEGARELRFDHPGITAVAKTQPVEGQAAPQPVPNTFLVAVAADTPVGLYEIAALGTYGLSNPRLFEIGDRPETAETEPNNAAAQATAIVQGATINGRIQEARDADWYRFAATAGQRVLARLLAVRLDSRLDASLELYDAQGRLLEISRDDLGRDPLVDFTVPADGEYLLRVYDAQYSGGQEFFYRLTVGAVPHIDFVFPPAVAAGGPARITLYGRNLPGASPVDGVLIRGRSIEQLDVELAPPADAAAPTELLWQSPQRSAALGNDGFAYRLSTPQGATNAALLSWARAPVVPEIDPNDAPEAAQTLTLPCECVGQFYPQGDVDYFTFAAEKGQNLSVEVFAQRLGTTASPYLLIEQLKTNDKGETTAKTIVEAGMEPKGNVGPPSFDTNTDDPALKFTAPETATYRILLRDLFNQSRGDPRLVYRLAVRPETPDFRVAVLPEFPNDANANPQVWPAQLAKGGAMHLTAVVLRQGGFAGPVELSVEGLPGGVSCAGATVGGNQNSTRLVLTAEESAADWAGPIRVLARGQVGEQTLLRVCRAATIVANGAPAQKLPAQTRLSRQLSLGVQGTAPFASQLATARTEVVQSARLDLPVKVTRRGEFQGAVALTGANLPDKVQNDTVTVPAGQTDGLARLFFAQDTPPGTYTLHLSASGPVPFTKNADGKDKKDLAVVTPSTPVTVIVKPGPLVLGPQPPGNGVIKKGAALEIPVGVNRRNEFAGPVTLDLLLPPGVAGVTAAEVVVPADQSTGTLKVQAAADASEGNHPYVAVRARLTWNEQAIEVHQPIPLNVQP